MLLEPHGRRRAQPFLLSCVHKFARRAEIRALAELDFGKDQILPVFCDDIDLAVARPVVLLDNCEAPGFQGLRSDRLAPRAERWFTFHRTSLKMSADECRTGRIRAAPHSAASCRSPCGRQSRIGDTFRPAPP